MLSAVEFSDLVNTGQSFSMPESDILDWTIVRPDGSEEGNLIGKYRDAHPNAYNP